MGNFSNIHKLSVSHLYPFYIYGVFDRGEEVIKLLEANGGVNFDNLSGNSEDGIYFIRNSDSKIRYADKTNEICEFIFEVFDEVKLPEVKSSEEELFKDLPKAEYMPIRGERVLVRDYPEAKWSESIFSYYDEDSEFKYVCLGGMNWIECIPFDINKLGKK